ncbi:MAG: hypothetical protein KKB81_07765 [Candidatus Margulisbacteria bacterium]|nr:hypothetical protein [Candidatus Margulisiibacteriota bacterium]MBU1021246.1 hypothetical protein [Candidatus Margulisiibacteriota bacterium]MBU1729851.1 hypothetical protein [Candidatus Margulisiibacteriota bacterium]MBU1955352.1 hypothetical protein [Candidatus Margulisiibacteriota bacterium]
MKNKMFALLLVLVFCLPFVLGFGAPPAKDKDTTTSASAGYPYLIDNFEDGDMDASPEWFIFDNAIIKVEKNAGKTAGDATVVETIGSYSIGVKGSTTKWYVGGMGTMIGLDATKYKSIEMDVYGNGEGSGKIKIEGYDDDNGNNEIEVSSDWVPKYDDLWMYEIDVNWTGWKHISIAFPSMTISNPGKGDGSFNPNLAGGSGGLIKMQLIFVAVEEEGDINFSIDNLELGK